MSLTMIRRALCVKHALQRCMRVLSLNVKPHVKVSVTVATRTLFHAESMQVLN